MDGAAVTHRVRQWTADALEGILPETMYAQYRLDDAEFVGRLDGSLEEAEASLEGAGYAYQFFAATKLHPDRDEPDQGSYRRLDPDDPAKQWHVHLWETDSGVDVFSHYEYKPEPWNPWDVERVSEHYRADYGRTYIEGQHSEGVKALLEEDGVYTGDGEKLGGTALEPPSGDLEEIFTGTVSRYHEER